MRLGPLALVIALGVTGTAYAGEVHTRQTAGTWTSDQQRGTLHGSIPNDAGYSFWLMGERIDLSGPVTVIVQVRFINHVDYGGAGIAIVDASASNQAQRNIRIELSEREDTAGVGGWLGNENHYSGASKRASKDIKTNEWYELALKVDGIRAIGYLDGTEVFNQEVPEIKQLGSNLTYAPFIVEADAEMRVVVRQAEPPQLKQPPREAQPEVNAKIAKIEPYAKDETDGSGVHWNAKLPKPSFDDDPQRTGSPNAEWASSYDLKGDRVCVRIASLRAPYPPTHKLSIGYTVTLEGAIFDNGSRTKTIVVMSFTGTPDQATAGKCETVKIGGTPTVSGPVDVQPDDPYAGDVPDVVRMPVTGRLGDLLPAKSKKQGEIEKLFETRLQGGGSPAAYKQLYVQMNDLILVLGKFHFFLEPVSRQWHVYNRVHDTWEPTGVFAGDATFSVVGKKVKVTKKKGRK